MAEIYVPKLLDGVGNGLSVPSRWVDGEQDYQLAGTEHKSTYTLRSYFERDDVYYVWAEKGLGQQAFFTAMFWHRELYRGSLVDAQKDLLHEAMAAAQSYTNVIMVVGYAALFTLWAQTKGNFTMATTLVAGIFLALSVLCFVGWEIFGMIVRSKANIAIGRAVNNPPEFEARMNNFKADQQVFMRRFYPIWIAVIGSAVGTALMGFVIMLCALMHGAWLAFLADSIRRVTV